MVCLKVGGSSYSSVSSNDLCLFSTCKTDIML